MSTTALGPPDPAAGWSHETLTLRDAIVVPATDNGFRQAAGVLFADGQYCAHGALWRYGKPLTTAPQMPEGPIEALRGTWLWGGVLWEHFGHFMVESTARLWPIPELAGRLDGVLFMPKRARKGDATVPFQKDIIDLIQPGLTLKSTPEPLRVETLIVPGQGFGLGMSQAGTAPYQDVFSRVFARDLAAEGSEKLYISRSALGPRKGGLIAEDRIEGYLAAQGFEIFHPQHHDLRTQAARYKAARTILAADGSALHLVACVGDKGQKVGIISRRKSLSTTLIHKHVQTLTGAETVIVGALLRNWQRAGQIRKHTWLGEHDLPALQAQLIETGFISADGPTWVSPTQDEIHKQLRGKFRVVE